MSPLGHHKTFTGYQRSRLGGCIKDYRVDPKEPQRQILPPHMKIGTFRSLINAETPQARACHVSAFVTRNTELWNADYRISLKNLTVSVFIITFAPKSLNDMEKNYNILNEDSLKVCEPELAFATERKVRKVNVEQLVAQGYMTLEQSKALIERKIHNHFHSR